FKAEHPDAIRSNTLTVCVGIESPTCDAGPEPGKHPSRISKIEQGQKFMRGAGPRLLRGRVAGTTRVKVGLRKIGDGGRKTNLVWKTARVDGATWSRRLPPLRPGRYRLFSRAIGTPARQPWIKGVNRVDFIIARKGLSRAQLRGRATSYLRLAVRTRTVRNSKLLRGWSRIALGKPRAGAKTLMGGRPSEQLEDGSFAGDLNRTAMTMIAISGMRPAVVDRAASWIASCQNPDGGFGFAPGAASDVDSTGLAAWALARAGRWSQVLRAADFVRRTQNFDGGFPAVAGGDSNAQSTGLGLLAQRMARKPLLGIRTEDGISPLHYLAGLQRNNGAIRYSTTLATTPSWVTAQALLGITPRARLLR
ncbi:MAG: terpene cyclase/mutase family protein, partial [Actinomycetota bacterium]|nr:terpene cyclase/mutase family protein [Actinomycetota bacterium]